MSSRRSLRRTRTSKFPIRLRRLRSPSPCAPKGWRSADLHFNPDYQLTAKERKYRLSLAVERLTGLDFSRKHFKLIA